MDRSAKARTALALGIRESVAPGDGLPDRVAWLSGLVVGLLPTWEGFLSSVVERLVVDVTGDAGDDA